MVARIASCFIAYAVIHTFSKGVARYMEVYFQREAYFNPIVKALAEEFVVVTLLVSFFVILVWAIGMTGKCFVHRRCAAWTCGSGTRTTTRADP